MPRVIYAPAADDDLADIGGIDAADKVQQRRFSGPAPAAQRDDFAAAKLRIHVVENDMLAVTFAEASRYTAQFDFYCITHIVNIRCWKDSVIGTLA